MLHFLPWINYESGAGKANACNAVSHFLQATSLGLTGPTVMASPCSSYYHGLAPCIGPLAPVAVRRGSESKIHQLPAPTRTLVLLMLDWFHINSRPWQSHGLSSFSSTYQFRSKIALSDWTTTPFSKDPNPREHHLKALFRVPSCLRPSLLVEYGQRSLRLWLWVTIRFEP